ncbi:MAG TPA: fibronectin type III domain-containing protein, partial [Ignavibacteria bacterium]|nr:fibronectin type III domain-containing protein [Ignavibacteria bacterium]
TDPSGIDGTNLPRLYYKKYSQANTYNDNTSATDGWKYVQGVLNSGTYSFTFDYTILYSGSVAIGDTIQYFVNAQDLATTPNVGINAGGYTTAPSGVALTAANFPVLGTINKYLITGNPAFSNIVYVGNGQTYTSLTKTGGLFSAINSGIISGNLNVIITSDITEDGTNQLQSWSEQSAGIAKYKITIRPDSAIVRNIYGWVSNSSGMIRLYGVNNVTFDGSINGSGRYLRIANRYVGSGYPTMQLYGGCTYDTIKNCILEGNNSSSSSGILLIGAAYTTNPVQPNNYLVISGNLVSSRTDSLVATANSNGITNYGSSVPYLNAYNQIINNEVKNCIYYPIYVSATGSGDGWIIKKNSIYYLQDAFTPAYTGTSMYGIYIIPGVYGSGYTVDSNYIGGSQALAGGAYMNIQGAYNGIYGSFGFNSPTSISGNVIKNIRSKYITANTSTYYSLYCGGGWMNITGNYIGSADTSQRLEMNCVWRGIQASSSFFTGQATVNCTYNTINNVWTRPDSTIAALSGSYNRYGIVAGGYLPVECSYNTIKNIFSWQSPGATSYNHWVMGILPNIYSASFIRNNVIDSICNFATAAPTGTGRILVYGMQPIGMGDGSVFSGNRISHVFTSTLGGGGDLVMGIYNAASYYGSTVTLSNNQVSLLDNSGYYANVIGVIDVSGSYAGGVCNWYDNSIIVGGVSGGLYNSYAYYRNTSTGVPCYTNMSNNILYNMRTGGGMYHAAIGTYAGTKNIKDAYPLAFDDENNKPIIKSNGIPDGNSPLFTSDYNYLVAPSTSAIGDWYGTLGNMGFWQTSAGTDANSVWDTTATVPAANLFRNYLLANLNIDTTSAKSLKIYKKGIGITGINTDFNGYPRATSGPVNIGSHEFTLVRPVNVSLVSPSNNAIDLYLPINMVWTKAVFASNYGIQISTDSSFATSLVNTTIADSVYSFTTGTTKTKYYWRVWPVYSDLSTGAYTTVWNFTTAPNSPNSPVLISPANNAINQPYTNLIFTWTKAVETFSKNINKENNLKTGNVNADKINSVDGSKSSPLTVSKYWFELSTDSTFTTVTVRDSALTDSTKTVASLSSNVKYWWRVKAKNQTGWGSFSAAFTFRTTLDPTFLAQANFISVVCPKYMASGTSTRLPVALRGTIQGLVPYKTYRYYNLFAISTDIGTSSLGAGIIMIINPVTGICNYASTGSLTTAGSYGTFVADAAGTYTGWFEGLNSGNARFTAGNYVYPSIVIGDSVGTVISRYAMNDSIQVLGFSTTAGLPNGTGIYGSSFGIPKNFVSLYD